MDEPVYIYDMNSYKHQKYPITIEQMRIICEFSKYLAIVENQSNSCSMGSSSSTFVKYSAASIVRKTNLFLSNLVEAIQDTGESICNPIIVNIIAYIHSHYFEQLSLKLLSVQFKINASYLGYLFKVETGEHFNQYLSNIRIYKAREYLSGTNMKIQEVAVKVGFFNPSSFYAIFRRVTHMSPEEYRKVTAAN